VPIAKAQKVTAERYGIDVTFEPERGFLRAKAAVTLRAHAPTEAVEFELNPRLEIKEVTDTQGRTLQFERSRRLGSSKLLVRLAEPVAAEQSFVVKFAYEGVPLLGGLDYITKEGILLRDEARWYPAVDLAAFTQNDIVIRLPRGWQALTSGEPIRLEGDTAPRYRTAGPVSSRSLVATPGPQPECGITEASHIQDPSGQQLPAIVELQFGTSGCEKQLRKMTTPNLAATTAAAQRQLLAQFGGPTRLKIDLGFPGQRGLIGYSAPGFLVVSEDVLKWAGAAGYAPEFLPHEMAHQWFPIEVTLAREEDGWLAESLAQYLAWRYLQETNPAEARALVARAMRDGLKYEPLYPIGQGLRLFGEEDWDVPYSTLYQRGMLAFLTLETVIGRSRVDRTLREYHKRYNGRSASIADFRKICEEMSDRDLGWFFDYYLDGTQIPEISLRRLPGAAPGELLGEIVVRNVPPEFQTRVEMRIHTTEGDVDHSVATRGEVTPFSASVAGQVTGITLDPDARILRWTEAARRNRQQRELLDGLGDLEAEKEFTKALEATQAALDADPENLAANEQQIRFQRGRLLFRLGQITRAKQELARVLELASLDQPGTDFYRAWARVYRARIALRQGNPAAARAEAKAGLAINAPALDTEVSWLEAPTNKASAAAELRALAK
jgi:tetratricopeptide (TPR) repeat protein